MRRNLSTQRAFPTAHPSSTEDSIAPRPSASRRGPIIAKGLRVGRRPMRRHEADTVPTGDGRRFYERSVAQTARKGRAGPRFHPGPQDGRDGRGDGARSPRGAVATRRGARGPATVRRRGDAIGHPAAAGAAPRAADQAPEVSGGRGGRGGGGGNRAGAAGPAGAPPRPSPGGPHGGPGGAGGGEGRSGE